MDDSAGAGPTASDHQDFWQNVTLDAIPPDGQHLLETYSGVPRDEILAHVLHVRQQAYQIAAFNCIGQVKFLNNRLPKLPYSRAFLERLHQGGKLVDVGCGLGQELRYYVVNERIESTQLCGFDLEQGLIDIGYELFRDRDRFKADLFAADLLGPWDPQPRLAALRGTADLVQVSQVLHVFDWDEMMVAAKRMVALGRAVPRTLIAGTQIGSRNAGSYGMPRRNVGTGKHYRHNSESMATFWAQVGKETDSQWAVECAEIYSPAVEQNKNAWWAKADPGGCMISFCAQRL